jgi:hypothetical protein
VVTKDREDARDGQLSGLPQRRDLPNQTSVGLSTASPVQAIKIGNNNATLENSQLKTIIKMRP